MYHKLSAPELRAGMYIVNTGVSWLQHPYLYSREGEATDAEIASLLADGYTEAYVDLMRCRPGSLPPELEKLATPPPAAPVEEFLPPPPRVSLREEIPKARVVFQASLNLAKNMMDGIRKGSFDAPSAEPVVEDIIESLNRNADALVSLCKLRQKDDYTYLHCVNASVLTTLFARGLGAFPDRLHIIGLGSLFHDVGKALVPLRILNAPRRLSLDEMEIMKRHPQLGYDYIVEHWPDTPVEVLQIVLEHHEQHGGGGYPNGIAGEAISLPGRIAAIVDVFDALSSKRAYKDSIPFSKALSILYSMRGEHFAPGLVEKFIRLLGVYPVGSAVELEDGNLGVVCETNPAAPTRPKVILVRDRNGKKLARQECDLSSGGAPAIAKAVTPAELGADPAATLGIPA